MQSHVCTLGGSKIQSLLNCPATLVSDPVLTKHCIHLKGSIVEAGQFSSLSTDQRQDKRPEFQSQKSRQPGILAHLCNPTQETES